MTALRVKSTWSGDESGQALAEYSLILTLIVAVCILAATLLGIAVAAGLGGILPAF